MALAPGTRLGPYEVIAPIGAGGMGEVYRARDTRLERTVAVKVLQAQFADDPQSRDRFEREARAISVLDHPNICALFDVGTHNGTAYLVMQYLEGEPLNVRLHRGALPLDQALSCAIQIADALDNAQRAGIVHRDLKPANVMLTKTGAKLLDFGVAKLVGAGLPGADSELTRSAMHTEAGVMVGTIGYVAPEQVRGLPVDTRADIWALGVILYELLTGRQPFAHASPSDVLAAVLDRDPVPLSTIEPRIPAELQRIVGKALKKDRERRYQTAKDLLLDLSALRDDLDAAKLQREPTPGDSQGPAAGSIITARRQQRVVGAIALVAGLVAGAIGGRWTWQVIDAGRTTIAPPQRLVPQNLTRLTFDTGLQTDVAWSADGRSIAYSSDQAGNFDVWVRRLDGGEPIQLTRSPSNDSEPAWSPDGATIVFHSDRDGGGLFIVPASGGPERRLTDFGSRPRWAPDGSQVLFAATDLFAFSGVPSMYTVRIDGEQPQQILQPLLNELTTVTYWGWYPDSRRVSILGSGKRGQGIYTASLSGGDLAFLPYSEGFGNWNAFEWAVSGTTLYVECFSNWARNIARFTIAPATMKVVAAERVTAGDGWQTRLATSVDGKRLAFTMGKVALRLWTFPFDAPAGRVTGAGEAVTDPDARVLESDLSRDGLKLAYRVARVGAQGEELWETDLATGESLRLTRDEQSRSEPHWSPDGTRIAYQWTRRRGSAGREQALAVRQMRTGEEQLIMTPRPLEGRPAVIPYDWSPDGQWLLVSSLLRGPNRSLGLWPLAATPHAEASVKVLAEDREHILYQAKFSPDGRWICFQAVSLSQPGVSTLFVMPGVGAATRQATPLVGLKSWDDKPRWSPDGKMIYFIRRQNSFFNLWGVRFDGSAGTAIGEPFQVTRFDSARREISPSYGSAEVGVSAKRLVLPIMEETGSIWMLD